MGRTQVVAVLELLDLALVHGVPAVISILEAFDKDEITLEDVRALGSRMRPTDDLRAPVKES